MSRSLGGLLLEGLGAFVLVVLVLSVVATIVGIVLGVVATIVAVLAAVAVFGLFAMAAIGLFSLIRGDDGTPETVSETGVERLGSNVGGTTVDADRDPAARLHDRYVDGEIDEAELEREIGRLFERDNLGDPAGDDPSAFGSATRDGDRLWER